ncbi:Fanconi anemia group J protein [Clonorchis sinensis]|uniref:Fanconi anemia group J protein n=1 Tax=Clonorchis sinensis TaxID=79923 RepID=A0A8T1MAX8_CLOSI|nr:Fanconi anemia group J protein [Clonorchis sinensis]
MDFEIQNIPISFPYKPYGCQLSCMNRVIEALESGRNCLIESPTGTGKTLSLLCSSLAWLNKRIVDSELDWSNNCDHPGSEQHDEVENGDTLLREKPSSAASASDQAGKNSESSLPKVYYCTRTHKQIAQIVRELRKTKYRKAKMTILSSRQHTCINPAVKKALNITEACQNLLLNGFCEFDQPRKKSDLARTINSLDSKGPWDLEDLVETLSQVPSCPYFCSRRLAKTADIVFCPYSYLLDPINRSATNLDLKGHVVILDEAHNIEDASREAASFKITEHQLLTTKDDLGNLLRKNVEPESCTDLLTMLEGMLRVMQLTHTRLVHAGESAQPTQVWTGQEISGILSTVGLGPEKVTRMEMAYRKLSAYTSDSTEWTDRNGRSEGTEQPKLASGSLHLFEALFVALRYMFRDDSKHLADYRFVLMETINYERQATDSSTEKDNSLNSWLNKRSAKSRYVEARELSLNFWCLNPSVVFSDLASEVRCLILVSGTLSPLEALEAELGVAFPIRLEAAHVIPKDRLLVSTLSHGPGGTRLCATFQNQNTFGFQDELGNLLLQACRLVPGGVLCFLPSYSLLDKLVQRWETTDLLSQLRQVKHVMLEPRSSVGLDSWLAEFYAAVDQSVMSLSRSPRHPVSTPSAASRCHSHSSQINGALVLAVCRGKVSEGLDFADAYGRLVIAVGIPYPAFNNPQVQQKREFNDRAHRSPGTLPTPPTIGSPANAAASTSPSLSNPRITRVLTGSEWYDAQAYRALNQALGRCIRHLNDWGAIFLVDARFVEQPSRYLAGISRWIRSRATLHTQWSTLASDLEHFVASHQAVMKVEAEASELHEIFD